MKWFIAIIIFVSLGILGIMLDTPKGTMVGSVTLQQEGILASVSYGTDNILSANARVMVYGPVERGAYVDAKGNYKIDSLPVGSYSVVVRANNYSSETISEVNVIES